MTAMDSLYNVVNHVVETIQLQPYVWNISRQITKIRQGKTYSVATGLWSTHITTCWSSSNVLRFFFVVYFIEYVDPQADCIILTIWLQRIVSYGAIIILGWLSDSQLLVSVFGV